MNADLKILVVEPDRDRATQIDAVMVLSVNGNTIGVSNALADDIHRTAGRATFLTLAPPPPRC